MAGKQRQGRKKPEHAPVASPSAYDLNDGPPSIQRGSIKAADGSEIRAPLVAETEWKDPTDTSAHARHHGARTVRGWRRVWQMDVLHNSSPNEISLSHVKAAERLLGDFEVGVEGASRADKTADRVDHTADYGVSSHRLEALERYQTALAALGRQASHIVFLVVITNWTITSLAEALGISRDRAFGRLQAGLERLREHYHPPRPNPNPGPQIEPRAMLDPGVTDIAQNRLGRWRGTQGHRPT